jgi:hypothetical protein
VYRKLVAATERLRVPLALFIAGGLVVALLGLGLGGVIPSLTPTSSAATTASCTTSDLVVWMNTTGNGAAGSSFYSLNFTNLSSHSCTLNGYPEVTAIESSGIQIGSRAARDGVAAADRVTLMSARAPSAFRNMRATTATVILQITVAQNFPIPECRPVTAAGLRVYPPGQKASTVVPYPFIACARRGPRFLHIAPTQKYLSVP